MCARNPSRFPATEGRAPGAMRNMTRAVRMKVSDLQRHRGVSENMAEVSREEVGVRGDKRGDKMSEK